MKKIKYILALLFIFILCGCNKDGSIYESNKVKVSIIDSVFFNASKSAEIVDIHTDFSTTLTLRDGYVIDFCSYDDYSIEEISDNTYQMTFKDITRPTRIKINAHRGDGFKTRNEEFETSIKFYYNDGTNGYEIKNYKLSYHIRQNTWTAINLKRDGYTLNGWNTKSDLTGTHVGLGSRVTVEKDQELSLYAEWVKWTDSKDLIYKKERNDTLSITGYKGTGKDEYIAIPEKIDGYTVKRISSSFTTNIPCKKIESKTLIIPNTISYVEDYAFVNSVFENIYFSDNINFSSYKCFNYNIRHYFLNAYQSPKLQNCNYNVRFADNIDMLIRYQGQKKLVLFGGCNFAYGIYSPMIEKEFSDYKVINCGINGEFNALFQIEIIETYLEKDDIFIHCPEQMNGYQFLTKLLIDSRVFAMVEGNYDLLGLADFSYSPFIIEAYTDYNKLRSDNENTSYEEEAGMFNTYGDYLEDRDYYEPNERIRDVSYTENWKYDVSLVNKDNLTLLGNKYNGISSKGVTVYFTYAPMNENSCESSVIYDKALEFDKTLKESLKDYDVTIISDVCDYIFKGRYFFDTDYHLNFYGAELRTEKLINDLKKVGVK